MQKRKLGNLEVPVIGFGCMGAGNQWSLPGTQLLFAAGF
jgi:aryl-alcohol dehydrogenase-like predicted oxidoreductase